MASRESQEFWREGKKNPQFGAPGNEFNLEGLRQGMSMRQEPADPQVKCIQARVGAISCQWVLAPCADVDPQPGGN